MPCPVYRIFKDFKVWPMYGAAASVLLLLSAGETAHNRTGEERVSFVIIITIHPHPPAMPTIPLIICFV